MKRQELLEKTFKYCREAVDIVFNSGELRQFIGDIFSKAGLKCDGNGGCNEAELCLPKKAKVEGIPKFLVQRLMERKEMRGLRQPVY